jgi:hypothetical protein
MQDGTLGHKTKGLREEVTDGGAVDVSIPSVRD